MTLLYLLGAHFLCDFALQGDYMARVKNPVKPRAPEWFWALAGHSLIHGAAVCLILQNVWLGLAEADMHFLIDTLKCEGRLSYDNDQVVHITCKLIWLTIALWVTR